MILLWRLLADAWTAIAAYAVARAKGCETRWRARGGHPPLPEIPASPAGEGEPR